MRNLTVPAVVLGITTNDPSAAAVDLAAAEARLRDLPLLVLSSGPSIPAQHRICTSWPGQAVLGRQVVGDLPGALIAASRTAALVVVEQDPEPAAGVPVALQVAAHSHCPTLVVPPTAPTGSERPVLLALSMSPEDEPAIGFAFEEAALRNSRLLAVHVWAGVPAVAIGAVSPFSYDLYQAQDSADRMVAETLAGWAAKHPDVAVDRMPLYDPNPAQTLLDASDLAELVVVGANHYGAHSSQLLGTVTRTLLRLGSRPVAVVGGTALR